MIGSCVVNACCWAAETHATDEGGCHLLGVEQRLIRGHIQMQIRLMDTTKHPQICAQGRARPFAGIAMHLAYPFPIVIARPFTSTVTNCPMCRMTSRIAVGLIGIQHGAPDRNVLVDQFVAGSLHPEGTRHVHRPGLAEQAAIGAPTLGAGKSLWVEVALQPDHANAGIEQLSYRKVNHIAMIPHRTLATHEPCSNCL